ncbi:F0F1 ATP synthase subunit B [Sorangium sp. So ce375]|uniref:F0F1 ATP synthase subunit B n=1 Tax=Sorangium sp. So ce375 TaxID=3133306 RepID=UPI003F5B3ADE
MHVSGWNIALQTLNFLVLAWLLQRFLWKPVARIVEARQRDAAALLGDAREERARAQRAEQEAQVSRAALAEEGRRELEASLRRAEGEAQRVREEAEQKARCLIEQARAEIAEERARALRELEAQATDLAITIAERLLREASPGQDALLVARAMQTLDEPEQRRLVARQLDDGRVEVVSASPLGKDAEQRLRAWLSGVAARPVALAFQVDPSMVAGLELRFPHGVWQLSYRAWLQRIAAALEVRDGAC